MTIGIILIAIFIIFVVLMYLGKLPALVSLPLMSLCLFVIAAIFYYKGNFSEIWQQTFKVVIEEGTVRLSGYIITIILGAVLAELLKNTGISKTIIKWASELGGDNKFVVCFFLLLVTALLFTVLGGLGAVIMVANLVVPIMLSLGVSPAVAGCIFLIGLSLGGTFNVVNWGLYINVLGLKQADIFKFAIPFGSIFVVAAIIFCVLNLTKGFSSMWAIWDRPTTTQKKEENVIFISLLTPLIPIALIIGFQLYKIFVKPKTPYDFPINSALIVGLIYGILTTLKTDGKTIQKLSKSIIEGISQVAPAVALIIGIGMIVNTVMNPVVADYMKPLLEGIIPSSRVGYVLLFSILAPLALYRGPLNLWGLGSGLVGIIMAIGTLPPAAIMAALFSVGMIQGVCDPTNTHNIWMANFVSVDVQTFTKKTIVYMWILAIIGLMIGSFMFM